MNQLFELLTSVRLNYVGQFELALQELRAKGYLIEKTAPGAAPVQG